MKCGVCLKKFVVMEMWERDENTHTHKLIKNRRKERIKEEAKKC